MTRTGGEDGKSAGCGQPIFRASARCPRIAFGRELDERPTASCLTSIPRSWPDIARPLALHVPYRGATGPGDATDERGSARARELRAVAETLTVHRMPDWPTRVNMSHGQSPTAAPRSTSSTIG